MNILVGYPAFFRAHFLTNVSLIISVIILYVTVCNPHNNYTVAHSFSVEDNINNNTKQNSNAILRTQDILGNKPLHTIAQKGNYRIALICLKHDPSMIDDRHTKNKAQETPISLALASLPEEHPLSYLLQYPLHAALQDKELEGLASYLITDLVKKSTNEELTAYLATQDSHKETVLTILERAIALSEDKTSSSKNKFLHDISQRLFKNNNNSVPNFIDLSTVCKNKDACTSILTANSSLTGAPLYDMVPLENHL